MPQFQNAALRRDCGRGLDQGGSAIGVFSVHNEPRRGPLENRSDSDLRGVTLRFHRGTDLDGYITLLDANTPYL